MSDKTTGPVVIELDEEDTLPSPATAPAVTEAQLDGAAMQTAAMLAARRPSALFRWFWRLLFAVILFFGSVAVWDGIVALLDRSGWLGTAGLTLTGAFVLVCVLILAREAAAHLGIRPLGLEPVPQARPLEVLVHGRGLRAAGTTSSCRPA